MTEKDFMTEEEVCQNWKTRKGPIQVSTLRKKRYTDPNHPPFIKNGAMIVYPRAQFFDWLMKQGKA